MIIVDKKPTKIKILGIILGFLGVVLLLTGSGNNNTNTSIYPMLLPLSAAFIYASGGIYTHHVSNAIRMTPTALLVTSLWIASIIGFIFPFMLNHSTPSFHGLKSVLPHIIILGCFCTGFANLLYFRLLKVWDTVSAMSAIFLVPVFSMFWSKIILNETITLNMLICCVLIIVGSLLVINKTK